MQYWSVERLDGIPEQYRAKLTALAPKLSREELLLVVLYFMSELDDDHHALAGIERNMRLIFPRVDYREYAASNIRGVTNGETQRVRAGKRTEGQRHFRHLAKGYWRNTLLGNAAAAQVLSQHGIELLRSGETEPSREERKEIRRVEQELASTEGKERERLCKLRANQGIFRDRLFRHGDCCRVCGLARRELLVASHIKGWAESTGKEKLDPDNGLLLCPAHDALFDRHLISFWDDGGILLAPGLTPEELALLNIGPDSRISVTEGNRKYLAHHRAVMQADGG